MNAAFGIAVVGALLAGCAADLVLTVDLRTDLPPGEAFVSVRTELDGRGERDFTEFGGARFVEGVRVAEFMALEPGDLALRVTLFDAAGAEVASRSSSVHLEGSTAVTVVISSACRGVVCPGPGDDPTLTICVGGRCVDPACSGVECAPPMCTTDAECAVPCEGPGRCAAGECLCPPPCAPLAETCNGADDDCDGTVDNGFDLESDPANCGSCGNACAPPNATPGCAAGGCTVAACDAGFGNCDAGADNGCETRLDTASDCGACGAQCSGTTSLCSVASGTAMCVSSCPPWAPDLCGASCVDAATDVNNCGSCGAMCALSHAVEACLAGSCEVASCSSGYGDCDRVGSNGCENTLRSLIHCGACGMTCARASATATCDTGSCAIQSCDAGWGDCDGSSTSGCEEPLTSLVSCGACMTPCSRANATATCATGACRIASCDTGWLDADATDANGCETRACTGVCGDANQDGTTNIGDVVSLERIIGGLDMPTACARADADVLQDGSLANADLHIVTAMILGLITTPCTGCTVACGDVDADGDVDSADLLAWRRRMTETSPCRAGGPFTPCEWWRFDTDGGGGPSCGDDDVIAMQIVGTGMVMCPAR